MNTQFLNFVLGAVQRTHPELATLIDTVIRYEPQIAGAIPVIEAAAKEGPAALAAAEKAAPGLAAAIRTYASNVTSNPNNVPKVAENIARQIAGQPAVPNDMDDFWQKDVGGGG